MELSYMIHYIPSDRCLVDEFMKECIIYRPFLFAFLIEKNIISVNFVDSNENSLLHLYFKYTYHDDIDLFQFIASRISEKMLVYAVDKNGDTIFHSFAKNMNISCEEDREKYKRIFYTLIEKGCSIFTRNKDGFTPLISLKKKRRYKKEEYAFLLDMIQQIV